MELRPGALTTQRGGIGEGVIEGRLRREGTDVYFWLIHVIFGRNQYNIIKQLSSNGKKKNR